MDVVKTALHGLVDGLGEDARLGLQVYGTQTGSRPAEKAEGCEDIVTVQPVSPVAAEVSSDTACWRVLTPPGTCRCRGCWFEVPPVCRTPVVWGSVILV